MITKIKSIDFTEPEVMHSPGSDGAETELTIFQVAERLERKYSVIATFVALEKKNIERILAEAFAVAIKYDKSNEELDGAISGQIRILWRAYILNGDHGITTKASEARGDPAFVDTSEYYLSLIPEVIHE